MMSVKNQEFCILQWEIMVDSGQVLEEIIMFTALNRPDLDETTWKLKHSKDLVLLFQNSIGFDMF